MTGTHITRVGPEYGNVLSALHSESFSKPWTSSTFTTLLGQPGVFAWVHQKTEPLGFVLARTVANEGEILTFATLPKNRRQGIGKCLLNKALTELRSVGTECVFLEVSATNKPAIVLYREFGFTQIGIRTGYYGDLRNNSADGRADAITMKLELQDSPILDPANN